MKSQGQRPACMSKEDARQYLADMGKRWKALPPAEKAPWLAVTKQRQQERAEQARKLGLKVRVRDRDLHGPPQARAGKLRRLGDHGAY